MHTFAVAAIIVATICSSTLGAPAPVDFPESGWTHEDYLEYSSLDSTVGWAGMSKVQHYNVTHLGQVFDFSKTSLSKRSGQRWFTAHTDADCGSPVLFQAANWGCGVCITSSPDSDGHPLLANSGHLIREHAGNPYPTADWYQSPGCYGYREHHQGISGKNTESCDSSWGYGVPSFASVMLYQGC